MARWSKKDYELVASLIREERQVGESGMERVLDGLMVRFSTVFKEDNPAFNAAQFVKAGRR